MALTGAAITVLAQLAHIMPVAPPFSRLLGKWDALMRGLWKPPLELVHIDVHPHIIGALNAALFMALLGAGGRMAARLSGKPLAPLTWRFMDDQTRSSLIVFAALCMIFLLGADPDAAHHKLVILGSEYLGRYAFAIIVGIGYFLGDFIGHREFHLRLLRLLALVAVLVAINFALLLVSGGERAVAI